MPRQTRRSKTPSKQSSSSEASPAAESSSAPTSPVAAATVDATAPAPHATDDAAPSAFFKSLAPAELMREVEEHPEQFRMIMIHAADMVANPYNPPQRGESEDELADILPSVREHGVLTPVLVVERSAVVVNSPDLSVDEGGTYVTGCGWRRRCAALMADKPWIPAIVRNELATGRRLNQLVVIENLNRKAISSIEEAQAYQYQVDDGQTLEEIAKDFGRGKSHISKRLQLLKLTEFGKKLVEAGEISLDGALSLVKLQGADYQEAALEAATHPDPNQRMTLSAAITQQKQRIEQAQQETQLREQLLQDGISEIDPDALWGDEAWQHRLDETEVEPERTAGNLAGAAVTHGRILYYSSGVAPRFAEQQHNQPVAEQASRTTSEDGKTGEARGRSGSKSKKKTSQSSASSSGTTPSPSGTTSEALKQADDHADAAAARRDACRRIVQDFSSLKDSRRNDCISILADAIVLGIPHNVTEREDVKAWCGIAPGSELDLRDAQRLALASALARLEDHASETRYAADAWTAVADRHVRRLADLGYHSLSEHEQAKLAN